MDAIEKQYFSKPRNHISIRHYVASLLDSGRIIEASFYCEKLLMEAPKNKDANKLAFLLAIRRMDPRVQKYDEALINSTMENKERFVLHCRYHFAFHRREELKNSLSAAMDEGLSDNDSLSIVLESLLWVKDASLTKKFISLYMRNARISPSAEKALKKILQTRLVEVLSSVGRNSHG